MTIHYFDTEVDLQSTGTSPKLNYMDNLIVFIKYNDPNLEFGLGTPHWHPETLHCSYF